MALQNDTVTTATCCSLGWLHSYVTIVTSSNQRKEGMIRVHHLGSMAMSKYSTAALYAGSQQPVGPGTAGAWGGGTAAPPTWQNLTLALWCYMERNELKILLAPPTLQTFPSPCQHYNKQGFSVTQEQPQNNARRSIRSLSRLLIEIGNDFLTVRQET